MSQGLGLAGLPLIRPATMGAFEYSSLWWFSWCITFLSHQDQSLGNWRLKRRIGDGDEIAYKFTPKYVLRAGQTVTVSHGTVLGWSDPSFALSSYLQIGLIVMSEGKSRAVPPIVSRKCRESFPCSICAFPDGCKCRSDWTLSDAFVVLPGVGKERCGSFEK